MKDNEIEAGMVVTLELSEFEQNSSRANEWREAFGEPKKFKVAQARPGSSMVIPMDGPIEWFYTVYTKTNGFAWSNERIKQFDKTNEEDQARSELVHSVGNMVRVVSGPFKGAILKLIAVKQLIKAVDLESGKEHFFSSATSLELIKLVKCVGQKYKGQNNLVYTLKTAMNMVGLYTNDGNQWHREIEVKDSKNITEDEWSRITGFFPSWFTLIQDVVPNIPKPIEQGSHSHVLTVKDGQATWGKPNKFTESVKETTKAVSKLADQLEKGSKKMPKIHGYLIGAHKPVTLSLDYTYRVNKGRLGGRKMKPKKVSKCGTFAFFKHPVHSAHLIRVHAKHLTKITPEVIKKFTIDHEANLMTELHTVAHTLVTSENVKRIEKVKLELEQRTATNMLEVESIRAATKRSWLDSKDLRHQILGGAVTAFFMVVMALLIFGS